MTYIAQGSREKSRDDIRFGSLTHEGMERTENQDFCGFYEPEDDRLFELKGRLFVVCDGMGGHAGGEIASRMGVEKVVDAYYSEPSGNTLEALKQAIEQSSRGIWDRAQEQPALRGMGSTSVVMALKNNMAYFGHVGDSRAYIVRGGRIEQITKDHSLVQRMFEEGLIDASEMENHPDKNVILRSMGVKPEVEVDLLYHPVEPGDIYLLCTDGLSGLVSSEDMLNIVTANEDPQEACKRLVDLANFYGGYDNITVQIVRIVRSQSGPPPTDMTTGVFTAEQVQASIAKARADLGTSAPPPKAPPPPPPPMIKTQPSMAAPAIPTPAAPAPRGGAAPSPMAPAPVARGGGKLGALMAAFFALVAGALLVHILALQGAVKDLRAALDAKENFIAASGGLVASDQAEKAREAEQRLATGLQGMAAPAPFGASADLDAARVAYSDLVRTEATQLGAANVELKQSLSMSKSLAQHLSRAEAGGASQYQDEARRREDEAAKAGGGFRSYVGLLSAESHYWKAANVAAKESCGELRSRIRSHMEKVNRRLAENQLTGDARSMVEAIKTELDRANQMSEDGLHLPAYGAYLHLEKLVAAAAGN